MTIEARVDMPTEETGLLQEENASMRASKRARNVAGTMLSMFAALAVVSSASSGTMRPIPTSFQDFRDHMPTWSFLAIVLLHSVREILSGASWEMGPALKLYCFALPYVIGQGSSTGDGWGPAVVQAGVILGVVATVLDQLRSGTAASWHKFINVGACGLLIVGTVKAVADKSNGIDDALPFIAWATTACAWLYFLLVSSDAEKASADGFNDSLWLLTLYTAAQAGDHGNADIDATLMKVACIVGAVYSVVMVLGLFGQSIQNILVAVTYAAIFVPLCLNTLRYTEFTIDAIWKNIAAYAFAVILGVRAILCLLFVFASGPSADDRTDGFVWLFVLCMVLQMRSLLAAAGGESSSFSNLAANLAQAGPAVGVVVLVLSLLGKFEELLTKLRLLAELITIVGILLS